MNRFATPLWAALLFVHFVTNTESRSAQVRNRFHGLDVLSLNLNAGYTSGLPLGARAWVYDDEPVVIDLTLGNYSGQSMDLSNGQTWFDRVSFALIPALTPENAERGISSGDPISLSSTRMGSRRPTGSVTADGNTLRFADRSAETVRIRLNGTRGFADVPAGIYALVGNLDGIPILVGSRLEKVRRIPIGVRKSEQRVDQLNFRLHMAGHAMREQDYQDARRWLGEMLMLHPTSVGAYTRLGAVAEAQGRCQEAAGHRERAVQILSLDHDQEESTLRSEGVREATIANLRGQIARCR
jgi:hypothetical protein